MAYRYGEREQISLLPPAIEDYVASDDPVRAYDAFIEALDLNALGISLAPHKVGNSEYNPRAMLKLLVYGYSYGVRSSRKLERATHHNLSFVWLLGGLTPDHKTIAEFRRQHKDSLKKVFKQCVRLCLKLDLIAGNVLFVDGTKIRANAGRGKNHSLKHYQEQLAGLEKRIAQLLEECENVDAAEEKSDSMVKMKKELSDNQTLQNKVQSLVRQFEKEENVPRTINQTDPDSALMKSIHGSHAAYNVQSVVDDKHGLIVHTEAVKATSDINQFARQIVLAEGMLPQPCEVAVADAGYADTEELAKIDQRGTMVIVPSQRQALHKQVENPFAKSAFKYSKEENCYYCPEGHKLVYECKQSKNKLAYLISEAALCHKCKHYGICTKAKRGRKIVRLINEKVKEKLERQYEAGQEIYSRRKSRVEHPFGHLKHNLGIRNFLLRGRDGVGAETALMATCFNVVRLISLLGGVGKLVIALGYPGNLAFS